MRVAVLLTCHNRRDLTLACLDRVRAQVTDAVLEVVVVDDGSTDGTAAAIRARHPAVQVVYGTGDLYWVGGMRLAYAHAAAGGEWDHLLLLNDDTMLREDALANLLATAETLASRGRRPAIVVGSTSDPERGGLTYGGVRRAGGLRRMRFELIQPDAPSGAPRECETMNANCVLVPREVVTRIGFFDKGYVQSFADYDYGLRARRAGCSVWVAPGRVGTCPRNPTPAPLPLLREVRRLTALKGGLPPREWGTFARRWGGPLWPLYALSPYVRRLGARVVRP